MRRPFSKKTWQTALYEVIYQSNTLLGKAFDIGLFILILLSVILVMLESVNSISQEYLHYFFIFEWVITLIFSVEYILRIICIHRPKKYIFSLYGIIDLVSILPMYIALFASGSHVLLSIRILRLLRIFRVLKLVQFMGEATLLKKALLASRRKIIIFIYTVVLLAIIFGTIMYLVEGNKNGFVSIPKSIYWTIVTLTTVGYGDMAPQTPLGQFIATFIMILGYGVIAVPTGLVISEISVQNNNLKSKKYSKFHPNKVREKSKFCYPCPHYIKIIKAV